MLFAPFVSAKKASTSSRTVKSAGIRGGIGPPVGGGHAHWRGNDGAVAGHELPTGGSSSMESRIEQFSQ